MADHGTFHWNELMTRDVESAKRFYQRTLGWSFEAMPMEGQPGDATYWIIKSGGNMVGGVFDVTGHPGLENVPEHWFAYIAVDDIDARCEKAREAGGTIEREPFDIPNVGRIAIIRQPGGGAIGWMTPPAMPG